MKIVVLLSQKGGTGKSTIATHLAVCAARQGKAVALFDIDPQASAAKWSDRRAAEGPPVVRAGAAQLPHLVQQARQQGADIILIDTAGHADASSLHALQLADLVLIPCRPSAADLDAIEDTIALAYTLTGTHTGPLGKIPPTGKKVKIRGMQMSKFKDGKMVECWGSSDELTLLKQIGVIPA